MSKSKLQTTQEERDEAKRTTPKDSGWQKFISDANLAAEQHLLVERLRKKIGDLKSAITEHRYAIWGDGLVENPGDVELYENLEALDEHD